jgi:enoyl-CoA hydratase/carnithine racemase
MSEHIQIAVDNRIGRLTLNRPQALHSLSLEMIRAITHALLDWRDDPAIDAVVLDSTGDKAFCAGGDIRFFYQIGRQPPQHGSLQIEDFFTEEYALNRLIHRYPKPYVALLNGIVMGGGMGVSQCFAPHRLRIVTERTRMAMPEVNIGLFPDIGASYFLSRCPGRVGAYLALTGVTIDAADALYAGLADWYLPSEHIPALHARLRAPDCGDPCAAVRDFASPFQSQAAPAASRLAAARDDIDRHFGFGDVKAIVQSLRAASSVFASETLAAMEKRSPLMMCVALEQLKRGAGMEIEDCLRMERAMMRHCFEGTEALEGIRAAVIDKDQAPRWAPARLEEVTAEMVAAFFTPCWPDHAHPLRHWL